jgi:hypothetical protein
MYQRPVPPKAAALSFPKLSRDAFQTDEHCCHIVFSSSTDLAGGGCIDAPTPAGGPGGDAVAEVKEECVEFSTAAFASAPASSSSSPSSIISSSSAWLTAAEKILPRHDKRIDHLIGVHPSMLPCRQKSI